VATKSTGKGRGGARKGAGRPDGSTNALALGEVRALKSLRHRVPDGAAPELADVAGEAFEAIVQVMRGEISPMNGQAAAILKASSMVREEVCGPVAQKLHVGGPNGEALEIVIRDEGGE
jgi:hypothetical protein